MKQRKALRILKLPIKGFLVFSVSVIITVCILLVITYGYFKSSGISRNVDKIIEMNQKENMKKAIMTEREIKEFDKSIDNRLKEIRDKKGRGFNIKPVEL